MPMLPLRGALAISQPFGSHDAVVVRTPLMQLVLDDDDERA